MKLYALSKEYNLYGAIITSWNWVQPKQLILQIDLANFNQRNYKNVDKDFRQIALILQECFISDTLGEGFIGFSEGDGRIIAVEYVIQNVDQIITNALKLVFMYDAYNDDGEKLKSIILHSLDVSVVDNNSF